MAIRQRTAHLLLLVGATATLGLGCAAPPEVRDTPTDASTPAPPASPAPPPAPAPPPPPPPSAGGYSRAALQWSPSAQDTCTREQHLRYVATGPDGKLYPTWHPPVDPATGCTYGHEHGRDPSGSAFAGDEPIIFGYASEQLEISGVVGSRHEDHVGHKIEWANGVRFTVHNRGDLPALTCDVLTKFHQGTHSPDAFTNNLHEIVKRVRCSDGTRVEATFLTANGPAGQLSAACRTEPIEVGQATPLNSPRTAHPLSPIRSIGNRFIPDRGCVDANRLHEVWKTQNVLLDESGKLLHRWAEYFNVSDAIRHYDPQRPAGLAYMADACYDTLASGDYRFQTGSCVTLRRIDANTRVRHDDPRSLFKGAKRANRLNDMQLLATEGSGIWYTNPLGHGGRPEPFPGSIRQVIITGTGSAGRTYVGPTIGGDYTAPSVHAPN